MRNILLALFALACYTFAAEKASLDFQASQPEAKGYTLEERDQMDELVGFAIGQYAKVSTYRNPTLKQRQAEAYATVYGITPQNMDADIFGDDQ